MPETVEKLVYEVAVEGTEESAERFAAVNRELERLGQVLREKPAEFAKEYAKSVKWLADAMGDASAKGKEFTAEQLNVFEAMTRTQSQAKKLAGTMDKDVRPATQKLGNMFTRGHGQAVKFLGAIGLGVYSMYSLASALRRGFRAVVEFVKGGIELAIKAHREWAIVIDSAKKKSSELQQELGRRLLPQIGAVAVAQRELMETLGDERSMNVAAQGIGNLGLAWAGVISLINKAIISSRNALDEYKAWKAEHPGWGRGFEKALEIGGRIGEATATLGASELIRKVVPTVMAEGRVAEEKARAERREQFLTQRGEGRKGRGKGPTYEIWARPRGGWGEPQTPEEYEYTQRYRLGGVGYGIGMERRERFGEIREQIKANIKFGEDLERDMRARIARDAKVKAAYVGMWVDTLSQAARSGDVKAAFANVALDMAVQFAKSMAMAGIASSVMGGKGGGFGSWLRQFFLGFQHEGLVRGPTLAMVGESGPEFIISQERMRGLLYGGRPGYEFGPKDFGMPNVNVAAPNVVVENVIAPDAGVNVTTAYRARAGEAELANREA